jgi:hypothetical protein
MKAWQNAGSDKTKSHFGEKCRMFERSLLTCCVDWLPVNATLMDFLLPDVYVLQPSRLSVKLAARSVTKTIR